MEGHKLKKAAEKAFVKAPRGGEREGDEERRETKGGGGGGVYGPKKDVVERLGMGPNDASSLSLLAILQCGSARG